MCVCVLESGLSNKLENFKIKFTKYCDNKLSQGRQRVRLVQINYLSGKNQEIITKTKGR